MSTIWLLTIIAAIAIVGFVLGRMRALGVCSGDRRELHSLPNYYGWNVAMKSAIPAFLILLVWLLAQPIFIEWRIGHLVDEAVIPGLQDFASFFVSDEVAGDGGPLADYGLVPDPELSATQEKVANGTTMSSGS